MTLVLSVIGKKSLWVLTDRRVSYSPKGARAPKDDAVKTMTVDTPDHGVAILGYAGLGTTAGGTQPSEWMSRVLRGKNLPLEQSLGIIAGVMQRQLRRHLQFLLPSGQLVSHHVIVPAFIGTVPRLYSIELVLSPDRTQAAFRYTRHEWTYPSGATVTPAVAYGGQVDSY